jgi:acetyl/propionyl-CoA carboxylase alpha subunit
VRVDTGVAEGDVIPPDFDSMIAKVIAWGRDRAEALARLRRALADTMVVIEGGTTNQGFLLALLDRPEVRSGDVDTTWLDRLHLSGEIASVEHADVALLQAGDRAQRRRDGGRPRALLRVRPAAGWPLAGAGTVRYGSTSATAEALRLAGIVAEIGPRPPTRSRRRAETVEVVVDRVGTHEAAVSSCAAETHRDGHLAPGCRPPGRLSTACAPDLAHDAGSSATLPAVVRIDPRGARRRGRGGRRGAVVV